MTGDAMIAAIDAQYDANSASVACVTFDAWPDAAPSAEWSTRVMDIAPYVPGAFWRRELPCIVGVLEKLPALPKVIVIDGYVWLDDDRRKGLGAHLFDALDGRAAIVGVAKRAFRGSAHAAAVVRGGSERPLYVTAEGIPLAEAASAIETMHGEHRIPTLLKCVDQMCRRELEVP